jgi:plastocyanin
VEADDYYFKPTFVRCEPGQRLSWSSRTGRLPSTTSRPLGLGIDRDLPPKGKVRFDVTFPASGVLRLYCEVHEALGMGGELLADAAAPATARGDSREAAGCYATSSSANPVARL